MVHMNWRLVLGLGVTFGLLNGLVAVLGWSWWLGRWTVIAAVAVSTVIFARTGGKVFANGFFTGLLISVFQVGLALVLWNQFAAHNSQFFEEHLSHFSTVALIKAFLMALALLMASWGILIGLSSWLLYKLFGLHRKDNAAGSESD
jgi:ABC-type uncharacterized transport system permease subunit